MIRCTKCGIDKDRCDCNNRIKNAITYSMIVITCIAMVVGCNTEKRAARLIDRGDRINPSVLPVKCAKIYKGTDSIDTRIEYRQGETITDTILTTEIEIVSDTVYVKTIKNIINTIHDTLIKTEFRQLVNTAAVDSANNHAREETARANKEAQEGKMWRSIAIILGLAIVLFLVIKFIVGKFK